MILNPTESSVGQYLQRFRRYYPGILDWYAKVQNEFTSGRRRMFFSWNGAIVEGLAITKNTRDAKLCHISVSPRSRNRGLGWTLMGLALRDMARQGAREVRVTTSEEIFHKHAAFFRAAGFRPVDWEVHRYRPDVSEILWMMVIDPQLWQLGQDPAGLHQGPPQPPKYNDEKETHWMRVCSVASNFNITPVLAVGSSTIYTTSIATSTSLDRRCLDSANNLTEYSRGLANAEQLISPQTAECHQLLEDLRLCRPRMYASPVS